MPELQHSVSGGGPPLLIMHGLFGSSRNWQSLARRLAEHFEVVNIDLRNHGESFHDATMTYPAMAEDVARLIRGLDLTACNLLGHSMGGKVAMMLAHQMAERIARLVVADIAPVTYPHSHADLVDAVLEVDLAAFGSRADVDRILAQRIGDAGLRAFLLHNLARDGDGWRWRVNWEAIRKAMDSLTGFDGLPADWRLDLPTLFIRGSASNYVGDAEVEVIERHFGAAQIASIDGAGHWLHAEQPMEFLRIVSDFLRAD
jgi:pimeloyl-ACP methyl ester carboxylesterase